MTTSGRTGTNCQRTETARGVDMNSKSCRESLVLVRRFAPRFLLRGPAWVGGCEVHDFAA